MAWWFFIFHHSSPITPPSRKHLFTSPVIICPLFFFIFLPSLGFYFPVLPSLPLPSAQALCSACQKVDERKHTRLSWLSHDICRVTQWHAITFSTLLFPQAYLWAKEDCQQRRGRAWLTKRLKSEVIWKKGKKNILKTDRWRGALCPYLLYLWDKV